MALPELQAPFTSAEMAVEEGWIDYNGHMNVAYYVLAFDQVVDMLFDRASSKVNERKSSLF